MTDRATAMNLRSRNLKPLKRKKVLVKGAVVAALAGLLSGCGGGTDGGKKDFGGSTFVNDGSNIGSISLIPTDTSFQVSNTAGFRVRVADAKGAPVPNLRITCDSEAGVAIIEPNTGSEITDSGGQISGKIGCSAPGSYQFGCRLPNGANLRQFKTIICSGPVPDGFAGFAGAAGGGLGGGAPNNGGAGPGGTDTKGVRIPLVEILDGPSASAGTATSTVDTSQGVCGTPPATGEPDTRTPEPFSDAIIRATVINNTNSVIRFSGLQFKVTDPSDSTATFTSRVLPFIGQSEIDPADQKGGNTRLLTTFAFAISGGKQFPGLPSNSATIGNSFGFQSVTVTISGQNDRGQSVRVSATFAISFNNVNNCAS